MATDAVPDDDALAWAGDEQEPSEASPAAVRGASAAASAPRTAPLTAPQTSPVLLVTFGLLGGLYLIYTLGWLITVQRSTTTLADPLGEIMFQFGEFLAIASPAIWFGAMFLLTRGRRPLIRLLLLVLGLIVVIPWPYILGA